MMAKLFRILSLALLLWLCVWIVLSWPAMQDDALIHLRYADHLLHLHRVSYNGAVPDFGSSSLLFVALLTALRSVFTSPLLPRAVSTVCHLLLFAGLFLIFEGKLRRTPRLASVVALLLLAALAAPSAVRWLDDGMETSLGLCVVALGAVLVAHLQRHEAISSRAAGGLAALGFLAVLLRVEFLLLLACMTLLLCAQPHRSMRSRRRCLAPLAGGLLAAAFILLTMHHLLPDTAIAKSVGVGFWRGTLTMTAETFLSSLSFGLLLLALWLLSGLALLRVRPVLPVLLANSLFPALLVVSTLRGQTIQGIRYFAWALLFSIVWNLLEPARLPVSVAPPVRWVALALCALYLLTMPFESRLFLRVFRQRAAAIADMRAQHLERLHDLQLTAYDVGFIGYFTQSHVCDLGGLVNGRAVAAMDYAGRIRHCAAQQPTFAFGDLYQLDGLNTRVDLSRWSVCATYDLANLHASDLHYLVAAPATVAEVCGVTGDAPQPLAAVLQRFSDTPLIQPDTTQP